RRQAVWADPCGVVDDARRCCNLRDHHTAFLITRSYAVPVAMAGSAAKGPRGRGCSRMGRSAKAGGRAARREGAKKIVGTVRNGRARCEFKCSEARRFEWHHRVRMAAIIASASVRVPV